MDEREENTTKQLTGRILTMSFASIHVSAPLFEGHHVLTFSSQRQMYVVCSIIAPSSMD